MLLEVKQIRLEQQPAMNVGCKIMPGALAHRLARPCQHEPKRSRTKRCKCKQQRRGAHVGQCRHPFGQSRRSAACKQREERHQRSDGHEVGNRAERHQPGQRDELPSAHGGKQLPQLATGRGVGFWAWHFCWLSRGRCGALPAETGLVPTNLGRWWRVSGGKWGQKGGGKQLWTVTRKEQEQRRKRHRQ